MSVTGEIPIARKQRGPNNSAGWEQYWQQHDGCEVSSSCLTCPLPDCVIDRTEEALDRRDEMIKHWRNERGTTGREIARMFHLSERTVWRVLDEGS